MILDNVKGQCVSSALEAFLTSAHITPAGYWRLSKIAGFPTNVLILFSGNDFIPGGDLWRRILTARIDPKTETRTSAHIRLGSRWHIAGHQRQRTRYRRPDLAARVHRGWRTARHERPARQLRGLGRYRAPVRHLAGGPERSPRSRCGLGPCAPISDPGQAIAKARELAARNTKSVQLSFNSRIGIWGMSAGVPPTLIKDAAHGGAGHKPVRHAD